MRAIINGLRYDTEKATFIGNASFGNPGDFQHWDEDLYVTPRSKRFFLDGSGGPMSRYAKRVETNSWSGSRRIVPITDEEAFQWMQDNNFKPEIIEEWFGDKVEDA